MKIKRIFDLKTSGSGCLEHLLKTNGPDTVLLYNFILKDELATGGFKFRSGLSVRFWSESIAPVIYNGLCDCIVELIGSKWLEEEKKRTLKRVSYKERYKKMRHFAVYMSGFGLLEVLAHDVIEIETKPGKMNFDL